MYGYRHGGGSLTASAIARALAASALTDAQARSAIGSAASLADGLRAIGLLPPLPLPPTRPMTLPDGIVSPRPIVVTRSGYGQYGVDFTAADLRPTGTVQDFIVDNVAGRGSGAAGTEADPALSLSSSMATINAITGVDVVRVRVKPRPSRMVWGARGWAGISWSPAAGAARKLIVEAHDGGPLIFVRSASNAPPTWTRNSNGSYTAPTGITGAANTSAPMDWLPAGRDAHGIGRRFAEGAATLATDASPTAGTYHHDTTANTVTVVPHDGRDLVGDEWVTPPSAGINVALNCQAAQAAPMEIYLSQIYASGGIPINGTNLQAAPSLRPRVTLDRCGGFASSLNQNGLSIMGAYDLIAIDCLYAYSHRDHENFHVNQSGRPQVLLVRTRTPHRAGYSNTADDNALTGHGGTSPTTGAVIIAIMCDYGPADGRVIGFVGWARLAMFGGRVAASINGGPRGSTVNASDNAQLDLFEVALAPSPNNTVNCDGTAAVRLHGMSMAGMVTAGPVSEIAL